MQLKERFDDPEFPYLLRYRFRREQKYGILSDIYNGQEYCKHSMFFASEYNVSFALNFDGAPKFKSSSVQVWPIQLYLNELPPHVRGSRQHMFLAGIWCSVKKPPTCACLAPILEELEDLATNGVKVTVRGEEVTCKARLLFTLADLPAKASLTNMIQFNGNLVVQRVNMRESRFQLEEVALEHMDISQLRYGAIHNTQNMPWRLKQPVKLYTE
jgi:hypothetical protein